MPDPEGLLKMTEDSRRQRSKPVPGSAELGDQPGRVPAADVPKDPRNQPKKGSAIHRTAGGQGDRSDR